MEKSLLAYKSNEIAEEAIFLIIEYEIQLNLLSNKIVVSPYEGRDEESAEKKLYSFLEKHKKTLINIFLNLKKSQQDEVEYKYYRRGSILIADVFIPCLVLNGFRVLLCAPNGEYYFNTVHSYDIIRAMLEGK